MTEKVFRKIDPEIFLKFLKNRHTYIAVMPVRLGVEYDP